MSAAWFWKWRGLNEEADKGDFVKMTKLINGGVLGFESSEAFWAIAKKVIVMIAISLCFWSCANPVLKAKRHWDAIEEILLKHPEIADSLNIIRHDTLRTDGFKDEVMVINDSSVWDQDFFVEADSLAKEVTRAKISAKAKPLTKLQTLICPALDKDSVYHVRVYNSKLSIWIPIHLSVHAGKGKIAIDILSEDVQIPEPQTIKTLEFKAVKPKFFYDQWFWLTAILLLLWVGTIVFLVRTR